MTGLAVKFAVLSAVMLVNEVDLGVEPVVAGKVVGPYSVRRAGRDCYRVVSFGIRSNCHSRVHSNVGKAAPIGRGYPAADRKGHSPHPSRPRCGPGAALKRTPTAARPERTAFTVAVHDGAPVHDGCERK